MDKDIAYCTEYNCPLRNTCLRYTKDLNGLDLLYITPLEYLDGECEDYLKQAAMPIMFDVC